MKDFTHSLHNARYDYEIVTKTTDDIIEECSFFNNREKLICKDIIGHLHRTAAEYIKNGKVANIPYIGCLRKSPIIKAIDANQDTMRELYRTKDINEVRYHVANIVNDAKLKAKNEDIAKIKRNKIKSANIKIYNKIYKEKGINAAIAFLNMLETLVVIPYDEEIEEMYRRLNNEE